MRYHWIQGYLFSVAGWTGAAMMFVLIRYFGLESIPQFRTLDMRSLERPVVVVQAVLVGWVLGTVFFGLDRLLDGRAMRRRPYGVLILLQGAGNVGFVLLVLLIVAATEAARGRAASGWASIPARMFSANFLVTLLYATLCSFLFTFLKQANRKFGPGNLRKLMLGTYHHPREEELIFMFLDLKGSTTHAERLGHVRFSRLIQDCFLDLSVVIDQRAQIYQYVGDEAILYWEVAAGVEDANCIRAHFAFADQLRRRAEYYEKTYGLRPEFKAGVNIGNATVLEVGEVKREISYLGDVLNTAARIQGKCNEYGEELLISDPLRQRLTELPPEFVLMEIGQVELRGREQLVHIFSVRRRAADAARAAETPTH